MRTRTIFLKLILCLFSVCLISLTFQANAFTGKQIRKVIGKKKSIYIDKGVFHNGENKTSSTLLRMRHSPSNKSGFERVVFDFSSSKLPQFYAHLSSGRAKLNIDFFKTKLSKEIKPFFSSNFVKEINFFPLADETLSAEVYLKKSTYVEIFYLDSPSRLVVDLKK